MTDRYTPEANAAIEQLQAAGFDYAEADMIYHGDMLGSALGAKTATLITSLREALEREKALHASVETDAADWISARRAQLEEPLKLAREVISDMVRLGVIHTDPGSIGGYYVGENVIPAIMGNPSRKETV
jgi:hypothetical protein